MPSIVTNVEKLLWLVNLQSFTIKGKIHTYDEYDKEDTKPVRINNIIEMFRGYDIMLKMLPMVDPTIMGRILRPRSEAAPKPKPKVKKDDSKDV